MFDTLVGAAMVYMLAWHIVPDLYTQTGYIGMGIAAAGFVIISILEALCRKQYSGAYRYILVFVFIGLAIHVALDGVALYTADSAHTQHSHDVPQTLQALVWVIVLHRLPVAMLVWSSLIEFLDEAKAFSILVLMAVVSVIGFSFGEALVAHPKFLGQLAYFESFIAGCLAHVVLHQFMHLKDFFFRLTAAKELKV